MVPYRPHSALIWPLEEVAGSDPTPSGSVAAARGYLESMTPGEAEERFGVQVKAPAAFQVEISDAGKFEAGSEVLINSRYYTVIGEPEIHESGLESDYAEVLLAGKDTPIQGV